jgi:hypothetical protein
MGVRICSGDWRLFIACPRTAACWDGEKECEGPAGGSATDEQAHSATKIVDEFVVEMEVANFTAGGRIFRGEGGREFSLGPAVWTAEVFQRSLFDQCGGIHEPTTPVQPSFSIGPR